MFPIAEAATAAVEISRVSALVGSSPSNGIQWPIWTDKPDGS